TRREARERAESGYRQTGRGAEGRPEEGHDHQGGAALNGGSALRLLDASRVGSFCVHKEAIQGRMALRGGDDLRYDGDDRSRYFLAHYSKGPRRDRMCSSFTAIFLLAVNPDPASPAQHRCGGNGLATVSHDGTRAAPKKFGALKARRVA